MVEEIHNPNVRQCEWKRTYVLQPHVTTTTIQLHMDPRYSMGEHQNPFKALHDELVEEGDVAIVRGLWVCARLNDFPARVRVRIEGLFDGDPVANPLEPLRERIQRLPRAQFTTNATFAKVETLNQVVVNCPPRAESHEEEPLYRPSLNERLMELLVGQEGNYYCTDSLEGFYQANHPLVLFLRHHGARLFGMVPSQLKPFDGERFYQVDRELLSVAREYLTVVGYSRLFKTTFKNCRIVIDTDMQCDAQLRSQCGPDRKWKPTLTFTLHMSYYRVHDDPQSYRALETQLTHLFPDK